MIILSLVLALYQGARIGAARMKAECVADISMNSVLSEYSRALFDHYGLMMVDTAYGTGNHSIVNAQEHLRHYAQKNFDRSTVGGLAGAQTMTAMHCDDASFLGYSMATDNGGMVLCRQILAYMAAEPVEGLFTDVYQNIDALKEGGLDSTDVEAMYRENQQKIDAVELPEETDEDGNSVPMAIGNPADAVNSQRGFGALNLAVRDRAEISKAVVNLSEYASNRKLFKGTGLNDDEKLSLSEKLLIEQYLYEKCSRYDETKEKALLKYQLEYLIYGKASDYGNLEKFAETLLYWREASNMLYLFNCEEKVDEAKALASALSIIFFVPELEELIEYSILLAWTFAESISDLNILFSGGRVPLFKSDSSWKLSITNMFFFREHLHGGDCGEGLYYKDYLRMKLLMTDFDTKKNRLMDVIEMDVRKTAGNSKFKLDYCMDCFRAELTIGTRYGYKAKIERIYGYEE
jgi:hypothetical protein